ncbi:MAG: ROK family protein [Negativicutes bacterium]
MKKIYIGLDIGGTKTMAAATDEQGNELQRLRADTPEDFDTGLQLLHSLITELSAGGELLGIGAACGGPLNPTTGEVSPLHQPEWRSVPLKSIMESRWSCRFAVDVDTNVAALGEYHLGGYSERTFLYITLSTGMGGGFLIDGKIYQGKGHPEIGHQSVDFRLRHPERVICDCGAGACLEALVSGSGIRRIYLKPAEELTRFEWDEVAYNFGQGLRNIAALLSPELIVLGGGVAVGGGSDFLNAAAEYMRDGLKIVAVPKIKLSRFGYDTALRGACWLARNSALS